ncbi:A/G-specific DNA-adenine glycosylase [Nitrosospira multiformis]|uniref:Adenine DNA glycosylase n=1 Tax=Nitrosospira multiformis TaxID=1231 RepID=A0A2T5IEC9_9PROT|nr:A/G-specific adenine glycosylase [Nitrosospira multiformis]PTQ82121.1 A/G-specific DNA-adenine glycosylase [Nitrosospira multiformis]
MSAGGDISDSISNFFAIRLIHWQRQHGRHHLPWQNTRDAYRVWLSEIMLQQTQVGTVIPYYRRFLQCFPDMQSLASASLDEVMAQWSGLGYYSRARNLHKAAQRIMSEHGGTFPEQVEVIRQLPGVGRSTAAAIGVFAFGKRAAILDGNVKRIFSRCFGIEGYPGEKHVETQLWQIAEALLPKRDESPIERDIEDYTQALMDLGATICTRAHPRCGSCPLRPECIAFRDNCVGSLPTPRPRKILPEREAALLLVVAQGKILLEKRPSAGIWGALWSLPEMQVNENVIEYCMQLGINVRLISRMEVFAHTFTHFRLWIYPLILQVISRSPGHLSPEALSQPGNQWVWMMPEDALKAAIPSPVRKVLLQYTSQIEPLEILAMADN